jgi:hypothetical protein
MRYAGSAVGSLSIKYHSKVFSAIITGEKRAFKMRPEGGEEK